MQNTRHIKPKKKIHFLPRTKLGKISAWVVIIAFIIIYINYWISMIGVNLNGPCNLDNSCVSSQSIGNTIRIILSFLAMTCIFIGSITSFISILKYKDYAISLFISALIGILGIIFLLGEFLVPH